MERAACDVSRVARASLACAGPRSRASQVQGVPTHSSRPVSSGGFGRVARSRGGSGAALLRRMEKRTGARTRRLAAHASSPSGAGGDDMKKGNHERAGRDAAAAAGKLAPLDVRTAVGVELEEIMKTDPVAFARVLTDRLRALATEVIHPSFPGGRSSALRHGLDPKSGGSGIDFDFRHAAGLHRPPHPAAASPGYLAMEGWRSGAGDDYVPNEAQDQALLRDFASAVERNAKKQRRREVEDILYLHCVHRFNNLGVPLAQHPGLYRGASLAASPAPNRHAKKVKRLVDEMLPAGAEPLLEKHLDRILANVDDPAVSGRVGSAGVPALTLAQVYSQSAAYGYFLQVVSRRLTLEHSFAADSTQTPTESPTHTATEMGEGFSSSSAAAAATTALGGAAGEAAANLVGALPAYPSAIGDWLDDGDAEWKEEQAGAASAAAAAKGAAAAAHDRFMALTAGESLTLESEMKSPAATPYRSQYEAFPTAIGDWFAPDDDFDVYVDYPSQQTQSQTQEEEREEDHWSGNPLNNQQRYRGASAEAARRAASGGGGEGVGGGAQGVQYGQTVRRGFGRHRLGRFPLRVTRAEEGSDAGAGEEYDANVDFDRAEPPEEPADSIFDASGAPPSPPPPPASSAAASSAAASSSSYSSSKGAAVPELQAFVESMDPQLRGAAARVIGAETASVLEAHVEALFGSAEYLSSRLAAALGSDPGGGGASAAATRAARVQRAAMNGDVDVVRMPLDGLRYLVVEAAAFGAALYKAEKAAEKYELIQPRRAGLNVDGFPAKE